MAAAPLLLSLLRSTNTESQKETAKMEFSNLRPGEQFVIVGKTSFSTMIEFRMQCGARVRVPLIPGGRIEVTTGSADIRVDIQEGDPEGLRLITANTSPSD